MSKLQQAPGDFNQLDKLRGLLDNCERALARISPSGASAVLTDANEAARMLETIGDSGASIAAERERFFSIEQRVTHNASQLVKQLGGKSAYAKLRAATATNTAQPIWQLDAVLQERSNARLRAIAMSLGAFVLILALAYVFRDTLFPPDPIGDAVRGAQRNIESGDAESALTDLNLALRNAPTNTTLLIWKGVVLDEMADPTAKIYFQQAVAQSNEADMLLERATIYNALLRGGDVLDDTNAVIALNPNKPEAYFVQASGYELTNQKFEAIAALEKTAELADAQDNPTLYASARIRLAQLLQASGAQ